MKLMATLLGCMVLTACGGGGAASDAMAPTSASIGGVVTGLPNGLPILLVNSGTETIAVPTNGAFSFAKHVREGNSYNVSILGLPNASRCAVTNGQGLVAHDAAGVSNVMVTCDYITPFATTFTYFNVGVTVSGLLPGSSVTLMNHGNDTETVTAAENGLFVFPVQYARQLVPGGVWEVTVKTQPSNQSCTVSNGSGAVAFPDVMPNFVNVPVLCK